MFGHNDSTERLVANFTLLGLQWKQCATVLSLTAARHACGF